MRLNSEVGVAGLYLTLFLGIEDLIGVLELHQNLKVKTFIETKQLILSTHMIV